MSFAAATVNVVTTDGPGGRAGVTVSAMSSVSADTEKPSLLVCINKSSSGAAPILENGVFCVNVLRDDQSFVSDTFAGRYGDKGEAKFDCAKWVAGDTGAPMLEDALVAFDCKLTKSVMVGTHHVCFGEVQRIRLASSGMPLIYANRAYGTPFKLPPAALIPPTDSRTTDTLRIACLSSFGPYVVPALLRKAHEEMPSVGMQLLEGDQDQVIEWLNSQDAALALLYDLDLPPTVEATPLTELRPYVLLAAGHPLASRSSVRLQELSDETFVLLDTPLSRDYLTKVVREADVAPPTIMRSSSFEMVRSLVANGAGYAILVTKPASSVSYDGRPLTSVQIEDDIAPVRIVIAKRSGSVPRGPAAIFLDLCQNFFASGAAV